MSDSCKATVECSQDETTLTLSLEGLRIETAGVPAFRTHAHRTTSAGACVQGYGLYFEQ